MKSEGTDRTRDEVREDARKRAELAAARLAGATEAVLENIDELTDDFDEALHEAAEITQQSAQEMRRQAATPEGRRLKETAAGMRHKISVEEGKVVHRVEELEEKAEEKLRKAGRSTKSLAKVGKVRALQAAHAVTETGRRAAHAPAEVGRDLRDAFASWRSGVASSLGLYALAGAIGAAAFVVLTVGLVGAANVWLGAPWGTLLIAGVYLVAAAGAVASAKAAKAKARAESKEQMEEARDTLQHVAQPMKDFWSDQGNMKAATRAAVQGELPTMKGSEASGETSHATPPPQRPPRPEHRPAGHAEVGEGPYHSYEHEEEKP